MEYFVDYQIQDPVTGEDMRFPVGLPVGDAECDTLFYFVRIFAGSEEEDSLVGALRVRRVLVTKIVNEERSVFEAMDQHDQLECDVYTAVFDPANEYYKFDEAMCGDLVIFEHLALVENAPVLHNFNINKILDDILYQVGDASLAVYLESYGDFTHFNIDGCEHLPGVGYARVLAYGGLYQKEQKPKRHLSWDVLDWRSDGGGRPDGDNDEP
jgi:hypothetical protein